MKDIDVTEMCNRSADICGREPIHLSSAIQPHGVLVGLRAKTWALSPRAPMSIPFSGIHLTADSLLASADGYRKLPGTRKHSGAMAALSIAEIPGSVLRRRIASARRAWCSVSSSCHPARVHFFHTRRRIARRDEGHQGDGAAHETCLELAEIVARSVRAFRDSKG